MDRNRRPATAAAAVATASRRRAGRCCRWFRPLPTGACSTSAAPKLACDRSPAADQRARIHPPTLSACLAASRWNVGLLRCRFRFWYLDGRV